MNQKHQKTDENYQILARKIFALTKHSIALRKKRFKSILEREKEQLELDLKIAREESNAKN